MPGASPWTTAAAALLLRCVLRPICVETICSVAPQVAARPSNRALSRAFCARAVARDTEGALFRPVSNNRTGELDNTITPDGVYKLVRRYALSLGLKIGAHALRATAATNALDHDADIAKVQEWPRSSHYFHKVTFATRCSPASRRSRRRSDIESERRKSRRSPYLVKKASSLTPDQNPEHTDYPRTDEDATMILRQKRTTNSRNRISDSQPWLHRRGARRRPRRLHAPRDTSGLCVCANPRGISTRFDSPESIQFLTAGAACSLPALERALLKV